MWNGARQVTCPNPDRHEEHRDVHLRPLLYQLRGFGKSAGTAKERTTRDGVAAAECLLLSTGPTHSRSRVAIFVPISFLACADSMNVLVALRRQFMTKSVLEWGVVPRARAA